AVGAIEPGTTRSEVVLPVVAEGELEVQPHAEVAVLVARGGEPEALHVVVLDLQPDAAALARVPGERTRQAHVVAGEGAVARGEVEAGAEGPAGAEAPDELGVAAPVLVGA